LTLDGYSRELTTEPAGSGGLDADLDRLRNVLGTDFPLLPPFVPPEDLLAELRSSAGDQVSLLGTLGARALSRWRRAMALVRPKFRNLVASCDAASLSGSAGPGWTVAQLPHHDGRAWVALPFDGEPPHDIHLSMVFVGGVPSGAGAIAGLLVDDWVEAIPERTAPTSITFHYDAPAARPPQAIVLAVDEGAGKTGWSVDALVTTVVEAFELAKLRMLRPDQIAGHGAVLPTTFLPRNLSGEMMSIDLLGAAIRASQMQVSAVLGKAGA
jgi:hypothetical protein